MQYGKIGRKVAVKIKSYLEAINSRVTAGRSLDLWKDHFNWSDDVWEDQGGSLQGEARSGGSPAYYLLLSCIKEAHRAKLSGAL